MRAAALVGAVIAASIVVAGAASATPTGKPRVTLIGDSIAASFDYVPSARRYLGRGVDLHSHAAVCRRLVVSSCAFQGTQPATALDIIRSRGSALGPLVVVDVGYNDWAAVYDVDKVMRALEAARVRTVVWVTLRETTSNYGKNNAAIRSATRRWQNLVVADWDTYSRGEPWFRPDGLHLNSAGATGLSHLLRPLVLAGLSNP
jgi:hypothetical protein